MFRRDQRRSAKESEAALAISVPVFGQDGQWISVFRGRRAGRSPIPVARTMTSPALSSGDSDRRDGFSMKDF